MVIELNRKGTAPPMSMPINSFGSEIVSIDDTAIKTPEDLIAYTRPRAEQPVTLPFLPTWPWPANPSARISPAVSSAKSGIL